MNKQKIYVLIMLLLVCSVFTHCTEKETAITNPETTELLIPSEETTVATESIQETLFANELDRDYPDEITTEPSKGTIETAPTVEQTVPLGTEATIPTQPVPVETEPIISEPESEPTEAPTVDIDKGYETDRDI